jgi:hypothetical protein
MPSPAPTMLPVTGENDAITMLLALRLHTSRLDPDQVTRRAGLRVTTVARTLADLIAGHRSEEQIHRRFSRRYGEASSRAKRLSNMPRGAEAGSSRRPVRCSRERR